MVGKLKERAPCVLRAILLWLAQSLWGMGVFGVLEMPCCWREVGAPHMASALRRSKEEEWEITNYAWHGLDTNCSVG